MSRSGCAGGSARSQSAQNWAFSAFVGKVVGRCKVRNIVVINQIVNLVRGGEGGIRTPDTVTRMPHFECGAFNHSATSPWQQGAKTSAARLCIQRVKAKQEQPLGASADYRRTPHPGASRRPSPQGEG